MTNPAPGFEISEVGERLVFRFPGQKRASPTSITEMREAIEPLLLKQDFKILSFEMDEGQFLPAQVVGFMISLKHNKEYDIELINPSDFVIENLELTHLDKYFQVRRSDD